MLREAHARGSPPGLDDQAADTAVSGGEALRSLHCAARSAVQVSLRAAPRGQDLKEAGGLRPPASLRSSPRGAARSDTCTALRAAQCRERRASPPLTAVSTAWSSSPGGEPLACASRSILEGRDPGRGEGGRLAPAGRGSRPERGEAEGLAECEGLPHRTSGTGH